MFIPRARQKDLKVLYYLCTSTPVSYDSISEYTGVSGRTCKEIVRRTNETISILFQIDDFILINTNGLVQINPNHIQKKFEIYFRIQLFWHEESPMSKLISLIVEKHNISREEARKELYLSESSFNKLLPKLNHHLKPFSIIVSSTNGLLSFEGNEVSVRNFLFKFLFYTYLNIKWPFSNSFFKTINDENIIDNNNVIMTSQIRTRAYFIAKAIFIYRFSTHHFLHISLPQEIQQISKILEKTNLNASSFFEENALFSGLEEELPNSEKVVAELFFRNYVPEIDSESLQVEIGKQFLLVEGKLINLAQTLVEKLDIEFNITQQEDSKYIRIYQLIIFLSLKEILAETFIPFISMNEPTHTYLRCPKDSIIEKISRVTSEYQFKDREHTNIINHFLYNLYAHELQKKVYIYLEFSKDQTAPYFIRNRLLSVYSKTHIIFTDCYKDADLIISDTFDIQKPSQKFFYLLDMDDKKGWEDLFFIIQKISLEKIHK